MAKLKPIKDSFEVAGDNQRMVAQVVSLADQKLLKDNPVLLEQAQKIGKSGLCPKQTVAFIKQSLEIIKNQAEKEAKLGEINQQFQEAINNNSGFASQALSQENGIEGMFCSYRNTFCFV